jgi:hypothetical protein
MTGLLVITEGMNDVKKERREQWIQWYLLVEESFPMEVCHGMSLKNSFCPGVEIFIKGLFESADGSCVQ